MIEASVRFDCSDPSLLALIRAAEEKCLKNIKRFGDKEVLIEGGGYEKVWIETQPMGGAMYGKRNIEVALNNVKIFMDHQREDGRLPGSIENKQGVIVPQFDKFQGFCFAEPALDVYYLIGKDKAYLQQLYEVLIKYDEYLWAVRDSDGDGCLESWCVYDTGEDNAVRYGDAPNYWDKDVAPDEFTLVPIASMDFMSYSYSARKVVSEIARLLGDEDSALLYDKRAKEVRDKLRDYLWDERNGAFFDRDKKHQTMTALLHNNLRTMYWGSMDPEQAKRFVYDHLTNPDEFWTKLPLPSVAANDPVFRNERVNNWSGQCQGLTYQRAIRALENYGYYKLIPKLGNKLFEAIGSEHAFVQQYDPFTMEPCMESVAGLQDGYGPTLLSSLEYFARMYGVSLIRDKLVWGCSRGADVTYEQTYGDSSFVLENSGDKARGLINGKEIFVAQRGCRIETDLKGKVIAKNEGF
ncbi:MGH1-like glycoside hydrolase domain-containing protein [Butyrivibrio proteoclasticus]|uniref:MGH1-like glycoside hydrolase domain-containing protein n=1 Tax=Butyrivibrio proteoclasticus TaxID=43305 RepID=UPI0006847DBF|nr:trehalase family glycosidase [Butyrivibrio proteoclasticus]